MSTTTPAGWYPDPKPSDPVNPGQRWWNGTDWTVSTKPETVPPVAAPKVRKRRPALVAGAVAAILGLGVGSLATYLIMDGNSSSNSSSSAAQSHGFGSGGSGGAGGQNPFGEGGSGSGGSGSGGSGSGGSGSGGSGGSGSGGSGGSSTGSNVAVDMANGITLPDPGSGWTGGTVTGGFAELSYGSYKCTQASAGCSLAGVSTSTLKIPASGGVQAAAEADMPGAVSSAYGTVTGHKQLEAQSVTVAGQSGYLIRWQVDAKVGNNGTVEDVVFPNAAGTAYVAVHFGFDIAAKAPAVSLMDTIVAGIQQYSGNTGGSTGPGTTS